VERGAGAVKSTTVARNYAQALLLAADAHDMAAVERYGQLMEAVAGAVQADERISVALESPRVSKAVKAALLERALEEVAPPEFVRFLQAVVRRGRQGLLDEIAQQYDALVDVKLNRVHAGVTLLEEPDARLQKAVIERLSQAIGKEVRAHFRADRGILGGVVVRVGDRIYDGSVRRKLATLRRKLVSGSDGGVCCVKGERPGDDPGRLCVVTQSGCGLPWRRGCVALLVSGGAG